MDYGQGYKKNMIFITKIDNHKEINKNLLNLINKINTPYSNKSCTISNTDWLLPKNYKRDYLIYFYKIIEPYMYEIADKLHCKNWTIINGWFQQYLKSDSHHWHTHGRCHFTNVYFVELPSKSLATEIFKYKKLKVETGDLLTFPAYYLHRSPINNLNKRKTIISFNSSFEEFNGLE
jgi:hypothetical protein